MPAVWSDGSRLLAARRPASGTWTEPHLVTDAPYPTSVEPLELVQNRTGDALVRQRGAVDCDAIGFVHLSTTTAQTLALVMDSIPSDFRQHSGNQRGLMEQLHMAVGAVGDAFVTYVHDSKYWFSRTDYLEALAMPAGGGFDRHSLEAAAHLKVHGLTLVTSPTRQPSPTRRAGTTTRGSACGISRAGNPCSWITRSSPDLVQDGTGAQTLSFQVCLRHSDGSLGPLSTLVATRAQPLVPFGPLTEQPLP